MIRQLLTAGTDTSSITVEWGIAELLRHPAVATKLREELDSVVGKDRVVNETDIINLPYLQAVTKEVFRLHPPTPLLIPHQSIEATVVAPQGFELPKSTRMFVNVYAIQRDPMVWERPLEFDPERFMKNPEIDVRGAHYQLLPFGSGRRQCPAMGVGILFVQMGLARIMHSFDLSLPQAQDPENLDITERFAINIWLATPLHVIAKPRLPKNLY
jgi:cytochrome P450